MNSIKRPNSGEAQVLGVRCAIPEFDRFFCIYYSIFATKVNSFFLKFIGKMWLEGPLGPLFL